jgi:hypothetical protein
MTPAGLKFLNKLGNYILACAEDPAGFSKHIVQPPPMLHGAAAKEWRRVASRLYEFDRLRPREILSLIAYCETYASWRKLLKKSESLRRSRATQQVFSQESGKWLTVPQREYIAAWVEFEHNELKQLAFGFGFFLGEGGMNLDQRLPTEDERAKARRRRARRRLGR